MRCAVVGLLAVVMGCATVVDAPPAPAKPSAAPAVIAPTGVKPAQAARAKSEAAKPAPARTLDVAALKERLRSTDAIGVFTKLALKNQMDDLLQQVRAVHQSGGASGVSALRQPYDMLVLKVLAVLQDGDPSLARMIAGSREAIWGILVDPVKFNALA